MISADTLRPLGCAVAVVLSGGCRSVAPAPSNEMLAGIRFTVDSTDTRSPAQGVLAPVSGTIEFADGRGRFTLTSVSTRAVAVGGVALRPPLGSPGDYYLFDSTGFVFVRPTAHTFTTFRFAHSWVHLGDARDPSEGFMEFAVLKSDTLHAPSPDQSRQSLPFTLRWHLDRRHSASAPIEVLARGWMDVANAPVGEAAVARWFGVSSAAEALSAGNDSLMAADLQLTTAVVLPTISGVSAPTPIVLHRITNLAHAQIAASRLVLPAGYTRRSSSGSDDPVPAGDPDTGARWRVLPPTDRDR